MSSEPPNLPASPTSRQPAAHPWRVRWAGRRRTGAVLLSLVLATAAGCWIEPYARRVDTIGPRLDTGRDGPPDSSRPDAANQTPTEAFETGPLPAVSNSSGLPPMPVLGLLPGGLRAVASDDVQDLPLASLQLTLRHRGLAASRLGLAEICAHLVAEAPLGAEGRASLRDLVERAGGTLRVEVDPRTTRFRIEVPRRSWRPSLHRLIEAVALVPSSPSRIEATRESIVRSMTGRLADDPLGTLVERVRSFELDGVSRWLELAEDATLAQVANFHSTNYRSNGAVLTAWVPRARGDALLRTLHEISKDWTAADPSRFPDAIPALPAASGTFWAAGEQPPHAALVLDLPPAGPEETAARLCLNELFSGGGIGGHLGIALEKSFGKEFALDPRLVDEGLGFRLEMRFAVPGSQVRKLHDAAQDAWQALTRRPPGDRELQAAARRAHLRALSILASPDGWLKASTHLALAGLAPSYLWGQDGPMRQEPPPNAWGQLLSRLEKPDADVVAAQVELLADSRPLLVVAGGSQGARAPSDTFADVPDAFVPSLRANTVSADTEAQEAAALQILGFATAAAGGLERISLIDGYQSLAVTRSGRGPEMIERTGYAAPEVGSTTGGRLLVDRRILNTNIVTRIAGRSGTETSGARTIELTPDEVLTTLDAVSRHPIQLLADWSRQQARYRMVSTRRDGDRQVAVLERVDDPRQGLRIYIDTESYLVRMVTAREHRGIGTVFLREEYRDYRNSGKGVRTPFHKTTRIDDSTAGLITRYQWFRTGSPSADEFAAK